ncbi:MAG: pyruvate ferredoxin oxidoreductase [Sulfolobales archaeon]
MAVSISKKRIKTAMIGNHAVAQAVKMARVKFIAAYPITPQTIIVERLADMVERKELEAEFVNVESEFAALSTVMGASLAGVRSFTATSSHGLLYMYEMIWWTAGARLPVVMAVVNRSIGPPWNIHVDHNDILTMRDSGWIIAMAENTQEVFDMIIQAYRVAEDKRVLLPVAIGLEGFVLSHSAEYIEIPEQWEIDSFLPSRDPDVPYSIKRGEKFSLGNLGKDENHMLLKIAAMKAMDNARKVIYEADRGYGKIIGREYGGLVERYKIDDAKYVLISMGSWSGTIKEAVDLLREEGYSVGLLRIRYFRPFPYEEILKHLSGAKGVVVYDRDISLGKGGIIATEVLDYVDRNTSFWGVVTGLGGVDVSSKEFADVFKKFVMEIELNGFTKRETVYYLGGEVFEI